MPLVVLQNDSSASASSQGGQATPRASAASGTASGAGRVPSWKLASQNRAAATAATAPTTTVPPTTLPPTTTTTSPPVSVPAANVVERAAVPSPTTTVPPTTTTTAPTLAATGGSVHYGQVTYYAHPAGTCASPFLPFGTVVRVTNPANGLSTTCLVNDREADTARSIDLATATFALLAPLSQGVINAELSW